MSLTPWSLENCSTGEITTDMRKVRIRKKDGVEREVAIHLHDNTVRVRSS